MPLLSVVVTVYNLENYIAECLNSILEQNIDDYEIVLVDNGSTDKSREICEVYAKNYSHINYISLDGESILGRAHQVGIAETRGEYVHIVDGDDFIAKGCYTDIFRVIKEKRPDVIFGSFRCCPEKGAKHWVDTFVSADKINKNSYQAALNYLMTLTNFHMFQWRFIVKKSIYMMDCRTKEELYSKSYCSTFRGDEINSTRILVKAKTIHYYDKPFYMYRTRCQGSVTSNATSKHFQDYLSATLGVIKILDDMKFDDIRKNYIFFRAITLFRLFMSGTDMFNHQDISELAVIVQTNKAYIPYLDVIQEKDIREFCRFIIQYGVYEGISLFCAHNCSKILSGLQGKEQNNIFVFPTGYYGELSARIIKNANINICGFLDNDIQKDGRVVMDLTCRLPSALKEFNNDYFDKIIVVISTVYQNLKPILKQQLLDIGLSEGQIVIKE